VSHASLLDHFSALDDPRQHGKVVYPLPEVMLVVLCGTLAGAEDFVEIATWGRGKLDLSHAGFCPLRAASPRMIRSTT